MTSLIQRYTEHRAEYDEDRYGINWQWCVDHGGTLVNHSLNKISILSIAYLRETNFARAIIGEEGYNITVVDSELKNVIRNRELTKERTFNYSVSLVNRSYRTHNGQ